MIFCFSGTGNSLSIAKFLAARLNERLAFIGATSAVSSSDVGEATRLGFVFPVHAWGPPLVVEKFLKSLPVCEKADYVYVVLTCGDDVGRTPQILRRLLSCRGLQVHAVFSLQMRNTYVCLPFFNVDAPELERAKTRSAFNRLSSHVVPAILARRPSVATDVVPGRFPRIKSHVLRPLFKRFLMAESRFHVSLSECNACGLCVSLCPLGNLRLSANRHPEWLGSCTHCLACFHGCPHRAVSYGAFTRGKGRVKVIR